MKVVSIIIRYILIIILTILLLAFAFINIASSTILNKEYVLGKLDETDYYNEIYQEIESNFEKYIYQSGLDEQVIKNIVSKEKVKKDVNIIISNIYDITNEKIDVEEIRTNLNNNIEQSINNSKLVITQRDGIDKFIDTICDEYTQTITHTQYEQNINNIYLKVLKYMQLGRKTLLIAILVDILLIFTTCYKNLFKGIASLGISSMSSGILLVIINLFINYRIKINTITILNNTISNLIRNVISNIVNTISNYGYILLGVGIVLIILGNLLDSIKSKE